MNFCRKSDEVISLYVDGLLDNDEEKELLEHIAECSECEQKLREIMYFAELCKKEDELELPENFSSSLHEKLLKECDTIKKTDNIWYIKNKRIFAGLSTAAILVISLIAYTLLPNAGLKYDESTAADTLNSNESVMVRSKAIDEKGIDDRITESIKDDENLMDKKAITSGDTELDNNSAKNSKEINKDENTVSSSNNTENKNEKIESGGSQEKGEGNIPLLRSSKLNFDSIYILNFAEFELITTSAGIKILDLKNFMVNIGATELKSDTINVVDGNINNADILNASNSSVKRKDHVDYYLTLDLYDSLADKALAYGLQLNPITGIIQTDITAKYNQLNIEKTKLENRIVEAIKNKKDVSELEKEKAKLLREINNIIEKKDKITIRIFY